MSQTHTTPDSKAESSETSLEKPTKRSKYSKDTSDSVMMRINMQKNLMMKDETADDFVETSREMVKFFAADPEYDLNYIMVAGVKLYVEGTVEETEAEESMTILERNQSFTERDLE